MANEVAIVKSIIGGAKAINRFGESRELRIGEIVYVGEKIVTDSDSSKVTIAKPDGKDITLIGKDSLNLNETTLGDDLADDKKIASIDELQKAILNGKDLNALEETAAGGNNGGSAGGDGVSLSSVSFAEGGHYSNISSDFRSINDSSVYQFQGAPSNISGASAETTIQETASTPDVSGGIEIPSSFYDDSISSGYFSNLGIAAHNAWLSSPEASAQIDDMKEQMRAVFENIKKPYPHHMENAFTHDQIENLLNEYTDIKTAKTPVDDSRSADLTNANNLARLFDIFGTQVSIGQKTVEIDGHSFQKAIINLPEDSIEKIGDSGWGIVKNAAGEAVAIMPIGEVKTGLKLEVGNGEIVKENLITDVQERVCVVSHGDKQKVFYSGNEEQQEYLQEIGAHTIPNPLFDPTNLMSYEQSIIMVDKDGNKITTNDIYNNNVVHQITPLTTLKLPASTLANLKIFGSDGDDTLVLNGVTVKSVYGGSGADNITVNNSTITEYISGDAGNDNITVTNSTINGKTITNSDGSSLHEAITGNSGEDTIIVKNSVITGDINAGIDNDKVVIQEGSVVNGNVKGEEGNDYLVVNSSNVTGNIDAGESSNSGVIGHVDVSNHTRYEDRISIGSIYYADPILEVGGDVVLGGQGGISIGKAHVKGNVVANGTSNQSADIMIDGNSEVDGNVIGGHGKDFINIRGYSDGTKDAIIHGKVDAREGDDRIDVAWAHVEGSVEGGEGDDLYITGAYNEPRSNASTIGEVKDISGKSDFRVYGGITIDKGLEFNGDTSIEVVGGGKIAADINLDHNNIITLSGSGSKITGDINFSGNGDQFVKVSDGAEAGTINLSNGHNEVMVGAEYNYPNNTSTIDTINGSDGVDSIKVFSKGNIKNLNIQDGHNDDTVSIFSSEITYSNGTGITNASGTITNFNKDSGDNIIHGKIVTDANSKNHVVIDSSDDSTINLSNLMEHSVNQNYTGVFNNTYNTVDISGINNAKLNINISDVLNVAKYNNGNDDITTMLHIKSGSDDQITLENSGTKNNWRETTSDSDVGYKTYTAEQDYNDTTYSVIIKVDDTANLTIV